MNREEFECMLDIYSRAKDRENRWEDHAGRATSEEVKDVLTAYHDWLQDRIEELKGELGECFKKRFEHMPSVDLPEGAEVKFIADGENYKGIYTGRTFVANGMGYVFLPDEVESWNQ